MREEGYYWVNVNAQDGWMIARWNGEYWILNTWSDNEHKDSDFDEIDEIKITREIIVTGEDIISAIKRIRLR